MFFFIFVDVIFILVGYSKNNKRYWELGYKMINDFI